MLEKLDEITAYLDGKGLAYFATIAREARAEVVRLRALSERRLDCMDRRGDKIIALQLEVGRLQTGRAPKRTSRRKAAA